MKFFKCDCGQFNCSVLIVHNGSKILSFWPSSGVYLEEDLEAKQGKPVPHLRLLLIRGSPMPEVPDVLR